MPAGIELIFGVLLVFDALLFLIVAMFWYIYYLQSYRPSLDRRNSLLLHMDTLELSMLKAEMSKMYC